MDFESTFLHCGYMADWDGFCTSLALCGAGEVILGFFVLEGDGFNSRLAVFQIAAFMGVKNGYFKVKNPLFFSV